VCPWRPFKNFILKSLKKSRFFSLFKFLHTFSTFKHEFNIFTFIFTCPGFIPRLNFNGEFHLNLISRQENAISVHKKMFKTTYKENLFIFNYFFSLKHFFEREGVRHSVWQIEKFLAGKKMSRNFFFSGKKLLIFSLSVMRCFYGNNNNGRQNIWVEIHKTSWDKFMRFS
jgi:hypothetical protein